MPKKNNAKTRSSREERSRANAESAASGALRKSPSQKSAPIPPALKPRRRRKRILMGEALRKVGLDELALAGNLSHVVDTLKDKSDETGEVEKLLVDVLKECARHLDDSPALRGASPPAPAPTAVHLVHNVSRPERPTTEDRK